MAGIPVAEPTPAAEPTARAMDRAVIAAMEGGPLYPDGTEFVPADLPGLGRVLDRCARERIPVVLVYPDGHERLMAVLTPGARASAHSTGGPAIEFIEMPAIEIPARPSP